MTGAEEIAVARALHIALGYESREVRIGLLKGSRYLDVRKIMARLVERNLVTESSVKEVPMVDELNARWKP